MEKSEILNLETRRQIYNYIQDNPGLHLHELARKLHIKYHNLRYHIKHLEKYDMIVVKSNNSYSRVYAKDNIGSMEKELFNIIRQKTPRNILLHFCYYGVCSQKELSKSLGKHPTTIEYHLKKLIDRGIVELANVDKDGSYTNLPVAKFIQRSPNINETLYRLKEPLVIIRLFWAHRESLNKDKVFMICYKQLLSDYFFFKKHKKHFMIKGPEYYVDLYIETIYDIFPHPYHV